MTGEIKKQPSLGDTIPAKALRIGAGITGAVPYVGPLIQTILTEVVPSVRIERVEAYIRYLQDEINELNLKCALETPEGLDLFEEGLWQSVRALSDKRRRYIVKLVASGITDTSQNEQMSRHFLRLLNQLGDEDIAVLITQKDGGLSEFQKGMTLARQRYLASFGLLVVTQSDLGGIGVSREVGAKDAYAITEIGGEFLKYLSI